jgi:hypothetical protein
MTWILKYIKELGLGTLFLALVAVITWVVNLNNTIERLEREKFDESKTRFIVQQEVSEMKGDLRDIKVWIYGKVKN